MAWTKNLGCLVLFLGLTCAVPKWYMNERRRFISTESSMRMGNNLVLNAKEQLVNHYLMLLKYSLITKAIWTDEPYPASQHYFLEMDRINNSTIFKIIEKMPKGGVLHVHSHAMTSLHWMVKHLTYLPNLWTKVGSIPREYKFSETSPGKEYALVADLREESGDAEAFDKMLEQEFSIYSPDPLQAYPSLNDVWQLLTNYFISCDGLWDSDDVNQIYFRQAIKEFYDDGVQYIEIRGGPNEDFVKLMIEIVEEFQEEHPDFIGIKHICATSRSKSRPKMEAKMDLTIKLMKKYPDLVKGFDMVSQEDITHTQRYFLNQLLDDDNLDFGLPYYFHAGETDWTEGADMNLIDAVLLNASRIGHGNAIFRHPLVLERIRQKDIAVELNPISNQVLGLLMDLRNHPGAEFFANDDAVVVSSDDPAVWYAKPLSSDFYMAFMGLGAVHDDLRLLKQLALNSFEYSTMSKEEKVAAINAWQPRWDKYIDDIIEEYKLMDAN